VGISENTTVPGTFYAAILAFGKVWKCQEIGKVYKEFGKLSTDDSANRLGRAKLLFACMVGLIAGAPAAAF
jgi:hypothetical protein